MWKRRNELKRERREYRTAEEVLAEQERADLEASGIATRDGRAAPAPAPAKMTVIDMRGSQAHVVTDLRELRGDGGAAGGGDAAANDDEEIAFPELQHNLRLIVDIAEAEIRRTPRYGQEKDTNKQRRKWTCWADEVTDPAAIRRPFAGGEEQVSPTRGATLKIWPPCTRHEGDTPTSTSTRRPEAVPTRTRSSSICFGNRTIR